MSDEDQSAIRLAVLEERVGRILSDAEGRTKQAEALVREVGDDATAAKTSAAEALAMAQGAKDSADGSASKFSRIIQWGTVISVVLAGLFAFSWWDAPRQARAMIDERVAAEVSQVDARITTAMEGVEADVRATVSDYLQNGDLFADIRYQVEQDGQLLVFRSGSILPDEWQNYRTTGLYANVDLDLSQFVDHRIFLSLSGTGGNWQLLGPTTYPLYDLDRNNPLPDFNNAGFSVFVRNPENTGDMVAQAAASNWRVDWLVVGSAEADPAE